MLDEPLQEAIWKITPSTVALRKGAQARKLLDYTEIPLYEIAVRCGFIDQAHFMRIFSRIVGAPPGFTVVDGANDLSFSS